MTGQSSSVAPSEALKKFAADLRRIREEHAPSDARFDEAYTKLIALLDQNQPRLRK